MTSKRFLINLLLILAFIGLVLAIVIFWLKIYTNHGQSLELPDYTDVSITEAVEDAKERSFEIIVNDSIHIVGKQGGLVHDQNPKPLSRVKENRKIYVTTTKYVADIVKLEDLRVLYGNSYNAKSKELSYLNIKTEIKSQRYDAGEPGHILEVWYKGELIDSRSGRKENVEISKGGVLEFVVSKNYGAQLEAPDLRCFDIASCRFKLEGNGLKLGTVTERGVITDPKAAVVVDQYPRMGSIIIQNQTIDITIAQEIPIDCQ